MHHDRLTQQTSLVPVAAGDVVITAGRDAAGRDPDPDATVTRTARDGP
jgi:hypothetical protein